MRRAIRTAFQSHNKAAHGRQALHCLQAGRPLLKYHGWGGSAQKQQRHSGGPPQRQPPKTHLQNLNRHSLVPQSTAHGSRLTSTVTFHSPCLREWPESVTRCALEEGLLAGIKQRSRQPFKPRREFAQADRVETSEGSDRRAVMFIFTQIARSHSESRLCYIGLGSSLCMGHRWAETRL